MSQTIQLDRRKLLRLPLIIMGMGLIFLVVSYIGSKLNLEIFKYQVPHTRLMENARFQITQSHLWFEA